MDALLILADQYGLTIVEDAAHAFGSDYHGKNGSKKIGSFGHLTCFSFDPIKIITTGEGGAITTRNKEWAQRLRKKRILGIDKDTWSRYKHERTWQYDVTERGYRYHLSNINAAIGIHQLKQIETFKKRRIEMAAIYDRELSQPFFEGKIQLLKTDYRGISLFTYTLRVLGDVREKAMGHLKERGILTGIHYTPNHEHTLCQNFRSENLGDTELAGKEILTLPLYHSLTDGEIHQVIAALRGFWT